MMWVVEQLQEGIATASSRNNLFVLLSFLTNINITPYLNCESLLLNYLYYTQLVLTDIDVG